MFGYIPKACTRAVKDKVKKLKLNIKPKIIPNGLHFPRRVLADNMAGRIGKMQGERIVNKPAKNAKRVNKAIMTV